jgi:hypothetical protein
MAAVVDRPLAVAVEARVQIARGAERHPRRDREQRQPKDHCEACASHLRHYG